jgi:hypothetical protein
MQREIFVDYGRLINNRTFFAEDFCCLLRSIDEGKSVILLDDATKAGDEKTDEIDIFI